jgi:hypothetical protein
LTKLLTALQYRSQVLRITRPPRLRRPKKPVADRPYVVSTQLEGHLRSWWSAARAAGNAGTAGFLSDFDWIGGTPDWPDWVHVGTLAQIAARGYPKRIARYEMGRWLMANGFERKSITVQLRNRRGLVKYTTHRTFYSLVPFRGDVIVLPPNDR